MALLRKEVTKIDRIGTTWYLELGIRCTRSQFLSDYEFWDFYDLLNMYHLKVSFKDWTIFVSVSEANSKNDDGEIEYKKQSSCN